MGGAKSVLACGIVYTGITVEVIEYKKGSALTALAHSLLHLHVLWECIVLYRVTEELSVC